MTTCRCTAAKHATSALAGMDDQYQDEIGWGRDFDTSRFNRYMDAFRTVFYLRKGLQVSGYKSIEDLHANELAGVLTLGEMERLSDTDVALILFRFRCADAKPRTTLNDGR
ncbi:MAG TPA: hypothetical protein PK446_00050 [Methanomassiliicoccaceae archaeon]|mgnify:CR=1 FL=1|nr:hypothetical protein [Methanomassiliicoccaceae archaeon]HPP44170.1 hypothetical protein [Methanomassiliicoccaceae archaeon]